MKPTRVLNLSNVALTQAETELLCLGMSFCPTPDADLDKLNQDLFEFTRKLRLKYHFRNMKDTDKSIVKLPSSFTPKRNADAELEKVINTVEQLNVKKLKNTKVDNLSIPLRDALQSMVTKVNNQEIVIKSADKGDITIIMSPMQCKNMCLQELNKVEHYQWMGPEDPSPSIKTLVDNFCVKYKDILTQKEYAARWRIFMCCQNYINVRSYMDF